MLRTETNLGNPLLVWETLLKPMYDHIVQYTSPGHLWQAVSCSPLILYMYIEIPFKYQNCIIEYRDPYIVYRNPNHKDDHLARIETLYAACQCITTVVFSVFNSLLEYTL